MWGVSYLSQEELREMYLHEQYERLRVKYRASAFVPFENKVVCPLYLFCLRRMMSLLLLLLFLLFVLLFFE
jgi:hypothetical protein